LREKTVSSLKKAFHHKVNEAHKGILKGEIQNIEIQRKINQKKLRARCVLRGS